MSSVGSRMSLARATQYAAQFVLLIADACERVAVAGSIRRQQAQVGDIEVLAIPKLLQQSTLFGDDIPPRDLLAETTDRLLSKERVQHRATEKTRRAWGTSYRRMLFKANNGVLVPVDLFWARPDTWGVQLAIRTGPANLSNALVTRIGVMTHTGRAGMLPSDLRVRDGLQQRMGTDEAGEPIWEPLATPDEWDFLQHIYSEPVAPERRR